MIWQTKMGYAKNLTCDYLRCSNCQGHDLFQWAQVLWESDVPSSLCKLYPDSLRSGDHLNFCSFFLWIIIERQPKRQICFVSSSTLKTLINRWFWETKVPIVVSLQFTRSQDTIYGAKNVKKKLSWWWKLDNLDVADFTILDRDAKCSNYKFQPVHVLEKPVEWQRIRCHL